MQSNILPVAKQHAIALHKDIPLQHKSFGNFLARPNKIPTKLSSPTTIHTTFGIVHHM